MCIIQKIMLQYIQLIPRHLISVLIIFILVMPCPTFKLKLLLDIIECLEGTYFTLWDLMIMGYQPNVLLKKSIKLIKTKFLKRNLLIYVLKKPRGDPGLIKEFGID